MALSNWDTLALNTEAKPCDGTLRVTHKDGNHSAVQIYKNWLYVRDTSMWAEGKNFVQPTIAEIQEGDVKLAGFDIVAVRGPQNSVLARIDYEPYTDDHQIMVGIGCYGFSDDGEWIGVQQETFEALLKFLENLTSEYDKRNMEYLEKVKNSSPTRFCQGDGYILDKLGINDNSTTPIGKAEDPIIVQMFRGPKDK